MTAVERTLAELAFTFGSVAVVGSVPHKSGFFANCAGVEVEAGSLAAAVKALAGELARTSAATAAAAARESERLAAVASAASVLAGGVSGRG